ncbi:glycerate kinase [Streptococcus caprae]|uniref:Glycerate kinase n=1 Tax=Streptococcus caprae TaxID=1640501 RepID=A0ABV8CWT6_9STRE
MKVVIAPDSFKESLTATEAAEAIYQGFYRVFPEANYDLIPVGDGGEGTVDAICNGLKLTKKTILVADGLGGQVEAEYARNEGVAAFECATVTGLERIPLEDRKPLKISNRGIGQLILFLLDEGVREFYIGVGGSSTTDGGIGVAEGLGYQFWDKDGNLIKAIGANLDKIARMTSDRVPSSLKEAKIHLLVDVTNPLCGPRGASPVFGPQKGLSPTEVTWADQALQNFYQNHHPALLNLPGAGAGGGLAAGFVAFTGARIVSGIDTVLDLLKFEERIAEADLLIVGEGKLDRQSLSGKAPIGLARRTPNKIPIIALCGMLDEDLPLFPCQGILAAYAAIPRLQDKEKLLSDAKKDLTNLSQQVAQTLKLGQHLS